MLKYFLYTPSQGEGELYIQFFGKWKARGGQKLFILIIFVEIYSKYPFSFLWANWNVRYVPKEDAPKVGAQKWYTEALHNVPLWAATATFFSQTDWGSKPS